MSARSSTASAPSTSTIRRTTSAPTSPSRLGRIFKIRYDLYQWKFLVKFINNFLAQVTPFLFYLIGGYFALQGRLDVGQLIAVIAAYKDLPGPLKELIDWDQARQDVQVKYAQVVEQFSIDQIIEPADPGGVGGAAAAAERLRWLPSICRLSTIAARRLLERVSVQIKPGETVALVGTAAGGAETLAEAFARLSLARAAARSSPAATTFSNCRNQSLAGGMSYASSDAYLFHGTLATICFYGLKHAPLIPATYDGDSLTHSQLECRRGAQGRKSGLRP